MAFFFAAFFAGAADFEAVLALPFTAAGAGVFLAAFLVTGLAAADFADTFVADLTDVLAAAFLTDVFLVAAFVAVWPDFAPLADLLPLADLVPFAGVDLVALEA